MLDPFRKKALERLSSPEELDRLVRVTRPRTWIALAGLLLVIVAVLLWATLTKVTTTASGLGFVLPQGGLIEAAAVRPGIVQEIAVGPGQHIKAGDLVGRLRTADGSDHAVTVPEGGQVAEILHAIGDFVPEGGLVAIVQPDEPLVVESFLPQSEAKDARVGDRVWVAPSTASTSEFGYALGEVKRIGQYPLPEPGIGSLLENSADVDLVSELGPVIHVVVRLVPAQNPSGVKWTASRGPAEPITFGTIADVKVVTGEQAPIDYFVG